MAKTTVINIETDLTIKEKAQDYFGQQWISLDQGIISYLKKIVQSSDKEERLTLVEINESELPEHALKAYQTIWEVDDRVEFKNQ